MALALAFGGCIPIPLALPPAEASLGLGAAVGNPLPSPTDGSPLSEAEPVVVGRIGVTPQAMWPEQHRRPIELDGGYLFHVFTNELRHNRNRHGMFIGLSVLAGDWWVAGNWRARLILRGSADYLVLQARPGDGGGASWAIGFEVADYVQVVSDEARPPLLGLAAGEVAIGAELFGSVHTIDGAEYGTIGFAIRGRWPATLGVVLIPLSGSF
ncbi:MAG: hypothetical protein H6719_23030 [Sandaracinaceae bacterium]|nr:hypothetical protein [Sandaracinaceae bacterium]